MSNSQSQGQSRQTDDAPQLPPSEVARRNGEPPKSR